MLFSDKVQKYGDRYGETREKEKGKTELITF